MKYTDTEIIFLKNNYPSHGTKYCSLKLNKSHSSIQGKAHRLGLKLKASVKSKILEDSHYKPFYKYNVNPNQFIKNFSKESSYVLGLLWADGGIHNKQIRISCIQEDSLVYHPIFQKTGKWNLYLSKSKNPKWRDQGCIYTHNRPLYNFLNDNTYSPHNIESADRIIEKIPKHLQKYWFRGLIDGDGCWYINKNHYNYQFSLAGPYEQDWSFFQKLLEYLGIRYSIQRRVVKKNNNRSSCIRITYKAGVIALGNYVYDTYAGDNIGLERKYLKFSEIKDFVS